MFETALKKTLEHEGGYAFVSGDRGGETYKGISRKFHPDWEGWTIIDRVKNAYGGRLPHNYNIKSPVLDGLVHDFYKRVFWDRIHLDQVHNSSLQELIFDIYVNSEKSGIKVIQSVLRNQFNQDIVIDGILGPKTIAAINRCKAGDLFNAIKEARIHFYKQIAQRGDNAKFLRGWLRRAYSFDYVATISAAAIIVVAIAGYLIYKNYTT